MISGTSLSCKKHQEKHKFYSGTDYSRGQLPGTLCMDFKRRVLTGLCPVKQETTSRFSLTYSSSKLQGRSIHKSLKSKILCSKLCSYSTKHVHLNQEAKLPSTTLYVNNTTQVRVVHKKRKSFIEVFCYFCFSATTNTKRKLRHLKPITMRMKSKQAYLFIHKETILNLQTKTVYRGPDNFCYKSSDIPKITICPLLLNSGT